ncbi:MAG: hypothetical protein ABI986_05875 [Chloroflexota bacterium]
MKIYKYWTLEKQKILIDGIEQEVTCYGGSNVSMEDARARAKEKAEKIQRKIAGEKRIFEDYESEIREEILQTIDDYAVVTRNRYGARVLNVEQLMILDIDKPKPSGGLFKKKDTRPPKEQIFEMVKNLASTKYKDLGFRIYETYQGARVIVLGKEFDPRDAQTKKMMDEFNCDPLYTLLCIKQGCYRARLTPKPSRMKFRGYKVKYPREGDDSEFQNWVSEYENMSRGFSVCKFIAQVGANYSADDVVRLHDDVAGVDYPQQLA